MALAGDHVQTLVSGYELTSDVSQITITDRRNMYDMTAFGDAVHNFIPGASRLTALEHNGYMNAAAATSHPVLRTATITGIISVLVGQNTAPAVGDPVYSLYTQQGTYNTMPEVGRYIPFMAAFANFAGLGGWGVALTPPISFNATTSGSSINNGASTAKGGMACLHVLLANASETYTIIVEGSATGAFAGEQTTLTTFSLNGQTLGSDYKILSGTIPQYTRWKATRTGANTNNIRIAVSLIRY